MKNRKIAQFENQKKIRASLFEPRNLRHKWEPVNNQTDKLDKMNRKKGNIITERIDLPHQCQV